METDKLIEEVLQTQDEVVLALSEVFASFRQMLWKDTWYNTQKENKEESN